DEAQLRDVRAGARLVRMERVGRENVRLLPRTRPTVSVKFRDVNVPITLKPVGERVFTREIRLERISVASKDHLMKNFPDRIAIGISRRTNVVHHSKRSTLNVQRPTLN